MMEIDFGPAITRAAEAFSWLAREAAERIFPIVKQLVDALVDSWDNNIVLCYVTPRQRHVALHAKSSRKRIARKWIHKGERNVRRRGR